MKCVLYFSRGFRHTLLMLTKTARQLGEARLEYLDADFHIASPGDYVFCAVTGRKIPLIALRYWSVDRQEAYIDAAAASKAMVSA